MCVSVSYFIIVLLCISCLLINIDNVFAIIAVITWLAKREVRNIEPIIDGFWCIFGSDFVLKKIQFYKLPFFYIKNKHFRYTLAKG